MPFDSLAAGVVYHSNVIALAPLLARYGGIDIGVRGTMELGDHVQSRFAVHVTGSASRLPYLDEMLGDEPIVIDAAVGNGSALPRRGAPRRRGARRVAALFEMNPNGTAPSIPSGSIRNAAISTAVICSIARTTPAPSGCRRRTFACARRLRSVSRNRCRRCRRSRRAVGMTVAGGGSGNHIVLGGSSTARHDDRGVHFDRLDAAFGGTLREAAVNVLRASGPWGTFSGNGAFSTQRFVAYGAYRGTFEGLQPFLGSAITGHGRLNGTVGVAIEPQRIVVQGSNFRWQRDAARRPTDAGLTLAVAGNRLRIYSADARAAGGDIVAAGAFSLGRRGRSAAAARACREPTQRCRLHGIGLPLDAGMLSATGNLAAGASLPAFDGGVTIARGRMANFSSPAAATCTCRARRLAAASRRRVRPDVRARRRKHRCLSSRAPAYDLDANVPAGTSRRRCTRSGFRTT